MPTPTRRILRKVASLLSRSPTKLEESSGVHKPQDEHGVGEEAQDPGLQSPHRTIGGKTAAGDETEFFFARVPPTVTYDELVAVFSQFGEVEVNLFRPFAEAKTSKGCGIVRFASSTAAAAAKAELHDKHKWSSDYAPMVLERVVEKKKHSNISSSGNAELIFTPKFLTNKKGINAADTAAHQQHTPTHRGSSSSNSLAQPELQHLTGQHAGCSTDGMARFYSCSSSNNSGSTQGCVRDVTRVSDRACCQPAAAAAAADGTFQLPAAAVESLISSDNNLLQSALLLQLPAGAGGGAAAALADERLSSGRMRSSSSTHDMGPHQPVVPSRCGSFEQQQQQQQQQRQAFQQRQRQSAFAAECAAAAWLQQYQLMGQQLPLQGFNEALAAAGAAALAPAVWPLGPTALLPCGVPPYGAAAMPAMSAAGAIYAAQPTSLPMLGGSMQQQQLFGCMNGELASGAALIPSGPQLPCDTVSGQHGHSSGLQSLTVVPTVTAAAVVDDSSITPLPTLSAAFNAKECFSNFSNLLDGHPSMQCAQARARMSGSLPMTQGVEAAAAECSASMLASGSSFCFNAQQQQQQQLLRQQQQLQTQQSGGNLQLTTGGLYVAQGGAWDSTNELLQQQQQHMLLESLSAADDEGYFDLAYKSSSSLDSLKLGDNPSIGSSYPPKVSSCSSNNSSRGVNAGCGGMSSQAAAELAARHQQQRLLDMHEQHQLLKSGQQAGMSAQANMPYAASSVSASGPGASVMGRHAGSASACGPSAAPWLLPQQQLRGAAGGMQEPPNHTGAMPGSFGGHQSGGASVAMHADQVLSVDLAVPSHVAQVVALHLPSIKSLTAADVQIVSSAAPGQLAMRLSGLLSQVQAACGIVDVLLQSQQQCEVS